MVVYTLLIINKSGGLVYNRTFNETLSKLSTNDYLILAGTFHSVHAITRSLTPSAVTAQLAQAITSTQSGASASPSKPASGTGAGGNQRASVGAVAAGTVPGALAGGGGAGTGGVGVGGAPPPPALDQSNPSPAAAVRAQLDGVQVLETGLFRMTCFQTFSGTKFLLFTEPTQPNVDAIMKRIYELYADYVMKNPFYQLEMPIRAEIFDRHLTAYLRAK